MAGAENGSNPAQQFEVQRGAAELPDAALGLGSGLDAAPFAGLQHEVVAHRVRAIEIQRQRVEEVRDRQCIYAASGGSIAEVLNTQNPLPGTIL